MRQVLEEFAIETGNEIAESALDNTLRIIDAELDAMDDAVRKKLEMEEDLQEALEKLRAEGYDNAARGLDFLFGKHKAVAAAVFLFQKRHAIAQAVVSGKAAVVETFKNAGGWPWGVAPAAVMAALNAANIASMIAAAPGISSTSSAAFGGGGGSTPRLPGASSPGFEDSTSRGAVPRPVTQIIFNGDVYGAEQFRDYLRKVIQEDSENDVVYFSPNSRQAMEIRQS